MALRRIYARFRRSRASGRKGVTLFEVVIVSAIAALLIAEGLPIAWEFYQKIELQSEKQNITAYLIAARARAMANKDQSPNGLYIDAANATIFEGASYASRNTAQDLAFPRSKIVVVSGALEIIFSQLSGTTTAATTTLSVPVASTTVVINPEGMVQ